MDKTKFRIILGVVGGVVLLIALFNWFGGESSGDLDSDDRQARLAAIANLETQDSAEAAQQIERLIGDQDVVVARRSIQALGRMKSSARPEMIEAALADTRPEIREAAVVALGMRHRDGQSAAVLRRVLADRSETPDIRAAAAAELGSQRDWAAMPELVAALNDESRIVRAAAFGAVQRNIGVGIVQSDSPLASRAPNTYSVDAPPAERAAFVRFFMRDYPQYKYIHDAFIEYDDKQRGK